MKSSLWVLGSVTLLSLGIVRCFSDNVENFLNKAGHGDEERTLKDENTEWALYKARQFWNELTNEITELSSLARSEDAACKDVKCFEGGICSDGTCTCGEDQYFNGTQCEELPCSLTAYETKCKCPSDTKKDEEKDGGKCEPVDDKKCKEEKDCGYGVCVNVAEVDTCRCFEDIATLEGDTCVLKSDLCASRELDTDNKKCKCEKKYTLAEDEITCVLRTCEDGGNTECGEKQEICAMDWEKDGYYCKCPEKKGKNNDGDCVDLCDDNPIVCFNGKCNPETGKCECDIGFDGEKCEILLNEECTKKYETCVETGGTCKSFETKENIVCVCPKGQTFVSGKGCTDLCKNVTCYYGQCMTETGNCSCDTGFDGDQCEILPDAECEDEIKKCVDTGGKCKVMNKDRKIECECSGDNKFAASRGCLSPADFRCINFPCYNGGSCNGENEDLECTCPEEFSGDHCEIFSESECAKKDKKCAETEGQCISTAQKEFICKCPEETSYVLPDGCKNLCENFVCYNGGECQQENGVAKCSCKEGFSGKKCEKFPKEKCKDEIDKCVETNGTCMSENEDKVNCTCKSDSVFVNDEGCQKIEDINCKEICGDNSEVICGGIKKNKEKIKCSCKNKTKDFDEVDKECKINYCKVKCGKEKCEGNKFVEEEVKCSCSEEDKDFVEEQKKCKTNYCKSICGTAECEAKDKYKNSNIKCFCNEEDYVFKDKKCIQACSDDSDCENDKICKGDEGSKTCDCGKDTFGDFCDKIVACEKGGNYEKCKDGKGDCKYINGTAVCECSEDNEALYEDKGYCHVQCQTNDDCKGNRKCNEDKFCVCKEGWEGDDCEEVTGCKELKEECDAIQKPCVFDESVSKLLASCECDDGFKYYRAKKECFPHCIGNKKCGDNMVCNEDKFCLCKEGYEGKDCSEVTGCKQLGEKCKEIGVNCIFDENSPGKATCNCAKGFKYDPKDNKCKHELCYPVNRCKPANCTFDESTKVAYCVCPENQYYSYETGKCKDFEDKCLLRKTPCGENEECDKKTGKCKCNGKKEGEVCKRNFCDSKPCFTGAECLEEKCFCAEGKYYKNKACKTADCNIKKYKTTCNCPAGKREKDGECVIQQNVKCENMTEEDCGYGICTKVNKKESCKCFQFAQNNKILNGKCTLRKEYCASGEIEENDPMKCKCKGIYKQADDGITCTLKTCDDDGVKEECESVGGKCVMKWKGDYVGYDCVCPEGYEKDSKRKCTDPCSVENNIKDCTKEGKVCYNSFSIKNKKTVSCNCPPTVELVNGQCVGKAANSYLFKNIPVLKKKYELESGINKVLLNKHLVESLQQTFNKNIYDFGYLFDYNVQGDIVNCSAWVNFKSPPTEQDLKKIKTASKTFTNVCEDCDDTLMIWPPNLFLSLTGLKKVESDKQDFCKVKDRLCGKGAKCTEDKDKNGKCTCDDGYQVVQYGSLKIGPHEVQVCEDINECALGTHKCPKNTECLNTIGNYSCVCKEGFKKKEPPADPETDKSDCVDLCTPSPCKKGKCVINEEAKTFDCECEAGAAGSYCQRTDEHYKSQKKNTVVVGAVLGTILIVGAIAVIYFIIKKKKKYGSEDFMPAPRMDHAEMTERRHVRGITNKAYE